jgi:3-phenylpropionate/trans-cinnamate dioxygenase ferredoxin component
LAACGSLMARHNNNSRLEAAFLMSAFHEVARLEDIAPGELLRVEVGARLVCLANVGGVIYAVDDDCTHTGGPLDEGELNGHMLTCPIHLAQFDVRNGQVLRGPAREPLDAYSVRIEDGRIFVADPDERE